METRMYGAKFLDCFYGRSLRSAYEKVRGQPTAPGRSRITDIDHLLKSRFWDLVEESVTNGEKVPLASLHAEICTYTHFYQNVINNPYKLCWLLTPNAEEHRAKVRAIENLAFKKIRKILSLPLWKKNGELDVSNSKVLISAARMLSKLR